MTAVVVQDTSSSFDSGAASAWTLGLASLSVGNLVYVWGGAGGDASTSQISETKGHVFTNIRGTFDATNSQKHASWFYIVSTTGTTTIDLGANWHTNARMGALEISGLAVSNPIDNAQEVGAIDTTTNGVDAASAGTLNTANANDFIVCSVQNINENEPGSVTWSAGTNFSGRSPTGTHVGKMETQAVTSTGSYNAVFTGNSDQRTIVHGVAFKLAGGPPIISSDPTDQTVDFTNPATFSVTASSQTGGTLNYQWQENQVDIASATNASVTVNPTGATDQNGVFDVSVWDVNGTTNSGNAVLRLNFNGGPYYLQEVDTSSRYVLEDGSGNYLMESWTTSAGGGFTPPFWWGDLDGLGRRFFKDRLSG